VIRAALALLALAALPGCDHLRVGYNEGDGAFFQVGGRWAFGPEGVELIERQTEEEREVLWDRRDQ